MLKFEGYTLDIARHSLRAADRDVGLRPKSFELPRYLVENPDRLVTKEELLKAIWPNVVVADESLTRCVSEVRQAIGDGKQSIIATVPRRGYRFTAPVVRVAVPGRAPPASDSGLRPQSPLPDRPSVAGCHSPISAATHSRTISATASPRTSSPSCRGSPTS
jgi:adenylate cyclase